MIRVALHSSLTYAVVEQVLHQARTKAQVRHARALLLRYRRRTGRQFRRLDEATNRSESRMSSKAARYNPSGTTVPAGTRGAGD